MLTAMPGFAQQTGEAALNEWIDGGREIGFEAQYASAQEDGNKLLVTDFSISYAATYSPRDFGFENVSEPIHLAMSSNFPRLTAENLVATDNGYSADRLSFGDGSNYRLAISSGSDRIFTYEGRVQGHLIEEIFLPRIALMQIISQSEPDTYQQLTDFVLKIHVGSEHVDLLSIDMIVLDDPRTEDSMAMHFEYKDFVTRNWKDGIIGEQSAGEYVSESIYGSGEGELSADTSSSAKTYVKNIDLGGLVKLFDPRSTGTSQLTPLIGYSSTDEYREEGDGYAFAIDRLVYENLALRTPQIDYAAFIDIMLADDEEEDNEGLSMLLEIVRSCAVGRVSADGVLIGFEDNFEEVSGSIGQVLLSNFGPDGLGGFSASSIDLQFSSIGSIALDKLFLGDIDFAPIDPINAFLVKEKNLEIADPLEMSRVFLPRSIATGLCGLKFEGLKPGTDAQLNNFVFSMDTLIPPIPTSIELTTEGLEFPVALIDDALVQEGLLAAGIDTLRLSESIKLRWDEESEDLVLDNFVLELGNVGRVRARARLSGVPKSLLQNPQMLEMTFATLNVKSVEIELENDGGVETTLALMATDAEVSEGMMKETLLMQLDEALATVGNDAYSDLLMKSVRAFLENPQNISIRALPHDPVPVSQIMSDAMIAPDMLPERLGIVVEANR
ncbi:MAG: hypothetical protein GY789_16945 [Hyphomicrobiales bacterium]|nr:hypothetical protein [Hyphomicrobiales bacterium]